jgi:threonine dehydrogenase-like Zn-dependent dehydrogenase
MSRPTAAGGDDAGRRRHPAGDVDALEIKDVPVAACKPDWVRIRVRAFGVNESEVTARRGESPTRACPASRAWAWSMRTAGCGRDSGWPR